MARRTALALVALAAGGNAAPSAPLTLLPQGTLGRCLDGTSSGFYLLPGDPRKFTITLAGGGECNDAPSCTSRLTSALGSSKYFAPSQTLDAGAHFADPNPSANPAFAAWTHVMLPYCSGDLHMGTRTAASADTFGLFFSGHLVLNETLNALEAAHGLGSATDILLSGDSAGGIGTWPHVDWLAGRFPSARVTAAPLAGMYFYAYPYTGPNHTSSVLASFAPEGIELLHGLYQPFLNEACAAAHAARGASPAPCMLSNYSYPYVRSAVFVTEAQTDQVQLLDHDDVPPAYVRQPEEEAYIAEWAANMSVALGAALDPANSKDGAFSPCVWVRQAPPALPLSASTHALTRPLPPGRRTLSMQGLLHTHLVCARQAHHCGRRFLARGSRVVRWRCALQLQAHGQLRRHLLQPNVPAVSALA